MNVLLFTFLQTFLCFRFLHIQGRLTRDFQLLVFHKSVFPMPLTTPFRGMGKIFKIKGNSPVSTTPAISKKNFGTGNFFIFYRVKYCWVAFYTRIMISYFMFALRCTVGKLVLLELFHPGDKLWRCRWKSWTNFNHRCVNDTGVVYTSEALKSLSPVSTTPMI